MTDNNENTKYHHLSIVILGKFNSISVGKDIVRLLGSPSHICIRVNKSYDSLLLKPCEAEDPMSFKVPSKLLVDHHCVFRIHSKMFVQELLLQNDLEVDKTYTFDGLYSKEHNTVIVPIIKELNAK